MENLDDLKMRKEEITKNLADAMKSEDETALAKAMEALSEDMYQRVMAEAKGLLSSADVSVLASRGNKALTSEETAYYKKLIAAMKAVVADPSVGLTNVDPVMPFTIIERVFEDLTVAHPILSEISFQMAPVTTTWVMHDHERQLAVWGNVFGPIIGEITSAFRSVNTGMCKLTAFMFMHKDMLDLGPRWVDRYVFVRRSALGYIQGGRG